ncbi:hypothetical protein P692DRAFT_20879402 [Suillus brevipes Sb2]|nr:hypothetical protein P692DRAFT_20879402 [Suillus brevipes Sb2]
MSVTQIGPRHRGNVEDLDRAIALHSEELALYPVGHTDRSSTLGNLANELSTRFDHRGDAEDLDQAIALHRESLALRPHDPRRSMVHGSLATVYLSFHRSRLDGTGGSGEDTDSLNVAMHHFKAAAEDWNGVVEEIRKIEGFSRFLLPPYSPISKRQLVMGLSSCSLQAGRLAMPLLSHTSNPFSVQLPTNLRKFQRLELVLRGAIERGTSARV